MANAITIEPISPDDTTTRLAGYLWSGTLLTPLRLILGWTYFSAFWRRLILENKLLPGEPGYIGEKFNHFLPNALLIKPAIEHFVTHPEQLWWKLVVFTIVEAVVGLALMLGLMTRLMGLATSLLALGILLGAGWLGTTCLDEWQIGLLGIGGGLACMFAGGGRLSIDYYLAPKLASSSRKLQQWIHLASSLQPACQRKTTGLLIAVSAGVFALTLGTNQIFHGGVWGTLHNKSVRPLVELSEASIEADRLSVQLYRVEGADVYGSFAIGLEVVDAADQVLVSWSANELAQLPLDAIENRYVAKIKPGVHSLVLPLGAKATLNLQHPDLLQLPSGEYHIRLVDISGASWQTPVKLENTHRPELARSWL